MVCFDTLQHTFKHTWDQISFANWRKYPNPSRPDIKSVDLLRRDFDPESGVLYTTRIVTMKPSIPAFLMKATGADYWYFIEEAVIDPRNNKMELSAKNISFRQYVEMAEKCTYTPDTQNKEWTHFTQEGRVTAFTFGFSKTIEEFAVNTFKQNATKGRELMEQAVTKIKRESEEKLNSFEEFGTRLKAETEERVGILTSLPS